MDASRRVFPSERSLKRRAIKRGYLAVVVPGVSTEHPGRTVYRVYGQPLRACCEHNCHLVNAMLEEVLHKNKEAFIMGRCIPRCNC